MSSNNQSSQGAHEHGKDDAEVSETGLRRIVANTDVELTAKLREAPSGSSQVDISTDGDPHAYVGTASAGQNPPGGRSGNHCQSDLAAACAANSSDSPLTGQPPVGQASAPRTYESVARNVDVSLMSEREQLVRNAAQRLAAQGLQPTVRRVRELIGGGSPNDISLMLERWLIALPARPPSSEAHVAGRGDASQASALADTQSADDVRLSEVWEAADALASSGQMPSMVRLRAKLGRGSTHAIASGLSSWYEGIGTRIAQPPPMVLDTEGPVGEVGSVDPPSPKDDQSLEGSENPKRPRGPPIKEHEVWDAADGLLQEGLRPTIERVRHVVGRGAPSTVSSMLERWLAALGSRLSSATPPMHSTHDAHSTRETPSADDPPQPFAPREKTRPGPPPMPEHLVWAAADALIVEGIYPTLDRVRGRLGGGSFTTLGPMVDRWFATLGKRLVKQPAQLRVGDASTMELQATVAKVASRALDARVPLSVANLAMKLWDVAQGEARRESKSGAVGVNSALLDEPRHESELRDKPSPLQEYQRVKLHLERADFEHARGGLENALASAHLALAALRGQLEEAVRLRHTSERKVAQLDLKLAEAETAQLALRRSLEQMHEDAQAAASEAHTRFSEREHSLLREVERERSAAQSALADLLKTQRERIDLEETFTVALDAERTALSKSRAAEAELRREVELAHALHTAALDASEQRAAERERISNELVQSMQRRLEPDSKGG